MDIVNIINTYAIPFAMGFTAVAFYVNYLKSIIKEVSDVLVTVAEAVEDNKVTPEEVAKIVKESKEVVEAAKKWKK